MKWTSVTTMTDADWRMAHRSSDDLFGVSAFGLLTQILRLNCLTPTHAFSALGVRLNYSEDWSLRLRKSDKLRASIVKKMPSSEPLATLWDSSPWQAFGSGPGFANPTLTTCRECMRSGFHSNLFQMPWVNQCPWHRCPLASKCERCSTPFWKSVVRDSPILLCSCGFDPVDLKEILHESPDQIAKRVAMIRRYLKWAEKSRGSRDAFGFEGSPFFWDHTESSGNDRKPWWKPGAPAVSLLVRHTVASFQASCVDGELTRIARDISDTKEFFIELPTSIASSMRSVSSAVASQFPEDAFSARERVLLGLEQHSGAATERARMPIVLLPAFTVTTRAFFDGRILSMKAQMIIREISEAICREDCEPERMYGLLVALERIVCRAYAEATNISLTRVVSRSNPSPIGKLWSPAVIVRYKREKTFLRFLWMREKVNHENP